MNKRKAVLIAGIIIVILAIGIVVCMRMGVFTSLFPQKELAGELQGDVGMNVGAVAAEGRELIALISSEEQAQEVAKQYGIELVEVEAGVAVFTTDQPLDEVIRKGETEGYLPLSINYIRKY